MNPDHEAIQSGDEDEGLVYIPSSKKQKQEQGKHLVPSNRGNGRLSELINVGVQSRQVDRDAPENELFSDLETDSEEDELEYIKWKERELLRIKRDHEKRTKDQVLLEDKKRRANMTEQERLKESEQILLKKRGVQSDVKYMQKYYSSFAFYQGKDDELFRRDYNIPVGMDTFDKSALPKRLQVRGEEFGRKGKSKYKDLMTEDTNNYQRIHAVNPLIEEKLRKKQGGFK